MLGHRGASAHLPENSLPAFARALADGADGVELDVRLTRDGHPVVFHDADLLRLAGDPRRVETVDWPELARIRLASGARVPDLAETLAELRGARLINVELKWDGGRSRRGRARLAEAVEVVLARSGLIPQRVLVSSFDGALLRTLRARTPSRALAALFEDDPLAARAALRTARAVRAVAVHPCHTRVDARSLARWRRAGYAVNVWTVDAPARVVALARLGVDAIISNDPGAALDALARAAPGAERPVRVG